MNKIIHFGATFKAVEDDEKDLVIEGMASTDDKDRVGDVIEPAAWKKGLANFKKNPVILFNHNYDRPIGKATGVRTTDNGLQISAKISKAAGEVAHMIKEGILGAFSVGFMVKDADYDSENDTFIIKAAELLEVSVVSVPANQAATFSVKKSFESREDYEDFVSQFKSVDLASGQELADNSDDALAGDTPEGHEAAKNQEKKMDPKEIQELMAKVAEETAANVEAKIAAQRAKEKAEEEAVRKAAEAEQVKRQEEEERVSILVKSNTETLIEDIKKAFESEKEEMSEVIGNLQNELKEKAEEIDKIRTSKYSFTDRNSGNGNFLKDNIDQFVEAKILGVITRKGWDTDFAKGLIEKAVNDNSAVTVPTTAADGLEAYETEVSTAIQRDIELELILDPMFRKIQMNAASMVVPLMPDANYAEFLATGSTPGTGSTGAYKGNLDERDAASPGANAGIQLGSKILTVSKLVAKAWIADEVEEDAIMPVLPLIRESMARSHARAIENSLLLGDNSSPATGYDILGPGYDGLFTFANSDSKVINMGLGSGSPGTTADEVAASDLLDLRQSMGKYGRRPGDIVYIVSLEAYYSLLDDPEFQNLNEVGARATKITGEVGQVFGTSVVVCDEFPAKAEGAPCAIAVNTRNFVVPVLRGIRVETDREVENQRLLLVSTQRRGFDRMFATAGQVAALTW